MFGVPLTHCAEGYMGTDSKLQAKLNLKPDTKRLWSFSRSGGFTREEMAHGIDWIHGSVGLRAILDFGSKRKFLTPYGNRTNIPRQCSPLRSPTQLTLHRLPIIVPIIAISWPECYKNLTFVSIEVIKQYQLDESKIFESMSSEVIFCSLYNKDHSVGLNVPSRYSKQVREE
jgi:hypothetical protein